jgi:hypothetical protein
MQAAVKVKSALSSIGSSPMESSDSGGKGEDTDSSLITKMKNSWLLNICLDGIATACKYVG